MKDTEVLITSNADRNFAYERDERVVSVDEIEKDAEFENVLKRFPRTFAYCSSVSEIIGTFFKNDKSGRYFGLFSKKNKKPRGVCGCENVAGAGVKVGENHSEEAKNENNDKND